MTTTINNSTSWSCGSCWLLLWHHDNHDSRNVAVVVLLQPALREVLWYIPIISNHPVATATCHRDERGRRGESDACRGPRSGASEREHSTLQEGGVGVVVVVDHLLQRASSTSTRLPRCLVAVRETEAARSLISLLTQLPSKWPRTVVCLCLCHVRVLWP